MEKNQEVFQSKATSTPEKVAAFGSKMVWGVWDNT